MGKKYFTISFDDGTEQDRRLIELMEKYGIKGTFNISSGIFGRELVLAVPLVLAVLPEQLIPLVHEFLAFRKQNATVPGAGVSQLSGFFKVGENAQAFQHLSVCQQHN